tara:strand:- start:93 stop:428 length:336 start_codon:yes stop_codon:yes gene_type:complete
MSVYSEQGLTDRQQKEVKDNLKGLKIVETYGHHSGGGCCHDLYRTEDGTIYTVHITEEEMEKSYEKWKSIERYLEVSWEEERGFGWEFQTPDYQHRHWTLQVEAEEFDARA